MVEKICFNKNASEISNLHISRIYTKMMDRYKVNGTNMKSSFPAHPRFIAQRQSLIFKLGIAHHYRTIGPVIPRQTQRFKQRGGTHSPLSKNIRPSMIRVPTWVQIIRNILRIPGSAPESRRLNPCELHWWDRPSRRFHHDCILPDQW